MSAAKKLRAPATAAVSASPPHEMSNKLKPIQALARSQLESCSDSFQNDLCRTNSLKLSLMQQKE